MRHLRTGLLIIALLGSACGGTGRSTDPGPNTVPMVFGTGVGRARLHVEIADEPEERSRGLMGRTDLLEDRGMAFLFEEQTSTSFWMKDTLIPLSIAFWDQGQRIVAILDMDPCESDPCRTYGPGVPFVGAVEANQGWFERNGVSVGDPVEFEA